MVNEATTIMTILLFSVIVMMFIVYAARYKKVPPNKAMVIFGRRMSSRSRVGYQVISGGGKFIIPVIESYQFLPLDVRALDIDMDDLRVLSGGDEHKARLEATVLVKVSSDHAGLMLAAEHLLGKTDEEINHIARRMFEGDLRTICRTTEFEVVDKDRDAMAAKIQTMASQTLLNTGIEIRGFTIHNASLRG